MSVFCRIGFFCFACLCVPSLIYGGVVGQWVADDLSLGSVTGWNDQVAAFAATAGGDPEVVSFGTHQVVRLDGDDQFTLAPGHPMVGLGDFTITTVFSAPVVGAGGAFQDWWNSSGIVSMELGGSNRGDFGMVIDSSGKIKVGRGGGVGANGHVIAYGPATVSDSVPHIATMTYEYNPGAGENSLLNLYIDGRLISSATQPSDGTTPNVIENFEMYFGRVHSSGAFFTGDLAEIRMHDTAMSVAEVATEASELASTYGVTLASSDFRVLADWQFATDAYDQAVSNGQQIGLGIINDQANLKDSSGNEHTGLIGGTDVPTYATYSVPLDGKPDYDGHAMRAPGKLWFGNDNELSITNDFSAWMRINVADIDTTATADFKYLLGRPGRWAIFLRPDGTLDVCAPNAIYNDVFDALDITLPGVQVDRATQDDVWVDIGVTFEGNSGDLETDTVKLYLDGKLVAETEVDANFDAADWLHVGGSGGTSQPFAGLIDRVVLWDGIVSAEEFATMSGGDQGLAGDLNDDGFVGSADLDIIRGHWGEAVPPGDLAQGDANGDGFVSSADLDIVRANWGATASAAVPEPATICLLVCGSILCLLRRRRW